MSSQYIETGKIVNTHGVRGEVKVQPWADSPDFLTGFDFLYIDGKPMRVLSSRVHKGFVIILFEGIEDINSAVCLRNKTVCIDRNQADLPEGSFFLQDLYGADVFTETGENIGKLSDILFMPANNVYVVRGKREYLIPAVENFILKTDIENNRLTVRLIDGM